MKTVFILTVRDGLNLSSGAVRGYLEAVDTGEEVVFSSVGELLGHLATLLGQQTTSLANANSLPDSPQE